MAANLALALDIPQHNYEILISKLEELSGYNGEDNRMLSELKARTDYKIMQLKLDPKDTKSNELYAALKSKFDDSNIDFCRLFSNHSTLESDTYNHQLVHITALAKAGNLAWKLKSSAAKDLLRKNAPKRVMKTLSYRSLESMLKREDIAEITLASLILETAQWRRAYFRDYSALTINDFEVAPIELVVMSKNKYSDKFTGQISSAPTLGAVALWPAEGDNRRYPLKLFCTLIKAINKVHSASWYYMSHQTTPDFGKWLSKTVSSGSKSTINLGIEFDRQELIGHLGDWPAGQLLFRDPHVDNLVLKTHTLSEKISCLHPNLRWWKDTESIGALFKQRSVSMNLLDIAHNHSRHLSLSQSSSREFSNEVRKQLIRRYIDYESIFNYMYQKMGLDNAADQSNYKLSKLRSAATMAG
jgi:hypothetical protein